MAHTPHILIKENRKLFRTFTHMYTIRKERKKGKRRPFNRGNKERGGEEHGEWGEQDTQRESAWKKGGKREERGRKIAPMCVCVCFCPSAYKKRGEVRRSRLPCVRHSPVTQDETG